MFRRPTTTSGRKKKPPIEQPEVGCGPSRYFTSYAPATQSRPPGALQTSRTGFQPIPTNKTKQSIYQAIAPHRLRIRYRRRPGRQTLRCIDERPHNTFVRLESLLVVGSIPGDLASKDVRADDSDGGAHAADRRETERRSADYAHTAFRPAVEINLGVRLHVKVIRCVHASKHT